MVSILPYIQIKRVKRKDTCTDHRIAWFKYVDRQNNLAYYIHLFHFPRSAIVNTSSSFSSSKPRWSILFLSVNLTDVGNRLWEINSIYFELGFICKYPAQPKKKVANSWLQVKEEKRRMVMVMTTATTTTREEGLGRRHLSPLLS